MLATRQITRSAPRAAAQLRAPAQRRMASSAQNEFIKERQHIKEHAKGTTGKLPAAVDAEMTNAGAN